jgi:hypothetical protein
VETSFCRYTAESAYSDLADIVKRLDWTRGRHPMLCIAGLECVRVVEPHRISRLLGYLPRLELLTHGNVILSLFVTFLDFFTSFQTLVWVSMEKKKFFS